MIPFAPPDYSMRLRIWNSLLGAVGTSSHEISDKKDEQDGSIVGRISQGKLPIDPDVDVSALAIKYELTGGFIKNAILTAILSALSRFFSETAKIMIPNIDDVNIETVITLSLHKMI